MSSYRPLGVKLIVVLLLLFALGSVAAALGYWYIMVNPSIFIFHKISYFFETTFAAIGGGILIFDIIFPIVVTQFVYRIVSFQLTIGIFSAHVIFYLILSPILIFVAVGLYRMRNWARVTTIIYSILTFIFAFIFAYLTFPPVLERVSFELNYPLFNINIPMVLLSLTEVSFVGIFFLGLAVSLIIGIGIPLYLSRDAKYEF